MLHSPTTRGWLGHPMSCQQMTTKKPLKPLQQVSLSIRMYFCYIEKCVLGWPKGPCEEKGKKINKINSAYRRTLTYGNGAPTVVIRLHFRKRIPKQTIAKMSCNVSPLRKPTCSWFLYLQLWIPLLWMIKGEKNVTWPNPGIFEFLLSRVPSWLHCYLY